jgi:hypothetical protein
MTMPPTATVDPVQTKLVNVLGRDRAHSVIRDTCRKLGLLTLSTADDRYRFGCELITQGGVLAAVGRAIKIQAILHGAREH